jgi:16S rRNA (cytidine1402-2'-O)-methyltransferase
MPHPSADDPEFAQDPPLLSPLPEPLPEAGPRASPPPDGLVLVSTPIGNLGDMTPRAVATLRAADLVLCEDTRTSARLLAAFDIRARVAPLHDHNEDGRIPGLLALLRQGRRVAVISDAGMPLVSDPGFRLVRAALAEGLPVGALPGANAAMLALVLSGLPPQPFLFQGFPPPRQAARRTLFTTLRAAERAGLSATTIWYEAPHRLAETLADMAEAFGPRPAAVARELTKKFEEVRRDTLPALAAHYAAEAARGEITIVVGPPPEEVTEAADLDAMLAEALQHATVKEAVAQVTAATGLPRKQVYARALALSAPE